MSSKGKRTKSRKSPFKRKSSKLSATAASMLNLSPVVEAAEDDYDFDVPNDEGAAFGGGAVTANNGYESGTTGSGDGNYGGDCNLRGLNEEDWAHENDGANQSSLPQHQRDVSFDSQCGELPGGDFFDPDRRGRVDDAYLQQQQRSWNARSQREVERNRLKSHAGLGDVAPPLPFSPDNPPPPPPKPKSQVRAAETTGGGYSVASDPSVGYGSTNPSSLPGFEEADLLQRAIERRALLHNRIVAMEAAKAELEQNAQRNPGESQPDRRSSRHHHKQQKVDASAPPEGYKSTSMRHPPPAPPKRTKQKPIPVRTKGGHAEDDSLTVGSEMSGGSAGSKPSRMRMGEHHQRMNELSERIKKEAMEFMEFESSYADKKEQLLESAGDCSMGDDLDQRLNRMLRPNGELRGSFVQDEVFQECIVEEDEDDLSEYGSASSQSSDNVPPKPPPVQAPTHRKSSYSLPSDDEDDCVGRPTDQQLSRYSNMVRLGIPDVAVLRSMERDGIADTHGILQNLKEEHGSQSSGPSSVSIEIRDRQDIWQRKRDSGDSTGAGEGDESERRLTLPLSDDPNYSKYFKMLRAKVPLSWVRRVLEVDGKDARVLDLDPDRPLSDQVRGAVDEDGNVDWDNVGPLIPASAVRSSPEPPSHSGVVIPADTFASVKAELAAMTKKAGEYSTRLTAVPSDESLDEDRPPRKPPTAADITSAAVAASNARLDRLKAIRAGGAIGISSDSKLEMAEGRRRESVDEIRRRRTTQPPGSTQSRRSQASNERISPGASPNNYDDIPLKDDPRFSKYFQMIRSRVPRSWVERVIEVDDRDPAILDLDPNLPLASQIEDEGAEEMLGKGDNETVDSTFNSLESESERSALSRSTARRSPTESVADKSEVTQQQSQPQPEESDATEAAESQSLPAHICEDAENDDNHSVASSITAPQQDEKPKEASPGSGLDLTKISAFLERIENQMNDRGDSDTEGLSDSGDKSLPRFTTTEEVENKLSEIIDSFDARKSKREEEKQKKITDEQELIEKNRADIDRLSSLLATKIGAIGEPGADTKSMSTQQSPVEEVNEEQSNLEKLPSLLTQVLDKMEQPAPEDVKEESKPAEPISSERDSGNKALEALFAKRAALTDEEEAKPKILREDPKYAKYFKMQKLGLPRVSIIQALERDGKDVGILDLDPNSPLEVQRKKLDEPAVPDKNAALKALFSKRAAEVKEKEEAPDKTAALKALFAKRAADAAPEQGEGAAPALKADPEYQKYMKMLKVGMPAETVRQALERDGKDPAVADMDPEKSYASQAKKKDEDPPIKEEYAKFFKMRKMGIPDGAVRQALQKEGKDPNILDMDPEKSYASQVKPKSGGRDEMKTSLPLKDDPEYSKFFKMLKMGVPPGAVQNALKKEGKDTEVINMDPYRSYASQIIGKLEEAVGPPLKDDPEYSKFFKMLKMGIPRGAVQNALKKEGKDADILDMDPEKSYASQTKDAGPPLKDDPEFAKFFKMLKMGIPLGAVQNALQKEGKDTNIVNLDPEKPLSQQQSKAPSPEKAKPKGPKVARKRLHWNKIDESKLHEKSFWNKAKGQSDLQLVGLDVDNEEFASLFTSPLNKAAAPKKEAASDAKKPMGKQKVQLIDGRRRMNGSILLTKFKVDYKELAKQVDSMEFIEAEGNQLRGMMQLLPTKDESLALRSYLPPSDAPQSEIDDAIAKLGECEQYMAVMLDVPDAKDKFQCMLFRAEFETQADSIRDGTKLLNQACDSVMNSERFKKLLLYALKLGNALNTGGANEEVSAITLDSLLKLAEAKAFDRQTSVLHYLVSIVQKNDEDVLKLAEDFGPVKAAERVAMDMLALQLKEMMKGVDLVQAVVKRHAPQRSGDPEDEEEEEVLGSTPMGKFSLRAASKITSLALEFDDAKSNFAELLQFFGEDTAMTPEAFFCTINTFVSMFDQTHKELKRREEAKERKKRIEEKRKLREEEMAAKKVRAK